MEAFLIYLLKSACILLLFYTCYVLFLRRETLFTTNRWFLISGLTAALFLPLTYYTKTVYIELQSTTESTANFDNIILPLKESTITWPRVLLGIYVLGVVFFVIRLLLQIKSLRKFIAEGEVVTENNFNYVHSSRNIQPFSFFNYIIYNPLNHNTKDLEFILAHEQVHVNQKHSLDILFIEIILLLQWFNPIAWGYRNALKQNLEFLADAENLAFKDDKKHYQYILLKQIIEKHNLSIVNPFFNSSIKKRIIMINQMPSQRRNVLKTLTIMPMLVLFLYSFNVKTEYSSKSTVFTQSNIGAIELIINKDASDEKLLKMKADLVKDGIDFSYTTVRNESGEIKSLFIQISGGTPTTEKFNSSFWSNIENDAIAPTYISIYNNSVSIGNDKKASSISSNSNKFWVSADNDKNEFTTQITEVKIEVDKDSKDETLKINSKFLSEKGVNIIFKGVKRNNLGEITAIKVSYDNNAGDKGVYKRTKKNDPIHPFKVIVDFKNKKVPKITIAELKESEYKVAEARTRDSNNELWLNSGTTHQTLKIKKDGDTEVLFLDGKKITQEELDQENEFLRKSIKMMKTDNILHPNTTIDKLGYSDKNVSEQIIRIDNDNENEENFVIIKKEDSNRSPAIRISDNKGENDPLYIIDGKEAKLVEDINPDHIESINVLKGKAAEDKYGEKGKNGVIEIIKKKN